MVVPAGRSLGAGVAALFVALLVALPVACTASSTSSADAPAAPARSVACADGSAAPVAYDVAIDDTRTTLESSPPLALISMGKNRMPYLVKLHAETCGPRAQLAYAFTRMSTVNAAQDLVAALGPLPPGMALVAPAVAPSGTAASVAEPAPQRIEGTRAVVRGEEIVLGEGVWPDGEPYRLSVTVR